MKPTSLEADIVQWDVKNWAKGLEFWSARTRQTLSECRALEIGSREGGLSLWMAMQGASVVCTDLTRPGPEALRLHESYGVRDRIDYQAVDALDIPYSDEFDVVMFKSVLGAVGRVGGRDGQARAVAGMRRALRKGGELFFAENLAGSPLHRFAREKFVTWGSAWRYVTLDEMTGFLSTFSEVRWSTVGTLGAFGRSEAQRTVLAALDDKFVDSIVPDRWKYIVCGVARK